MIQKLKQVVGQEAENIIANGMGLEKKGKKYRCPNGSAHKNNDNNPSMSWDPKALQFYCFTCKNKIDIYEYYRKYEGLEHVEIMQKYGIGSYNNKGEKKTEKENNKTDFKINKIGGKQIKYLQSRGINEETYQFFKLGNVDNNLAIPYSDSNGRITGIKIRKLSNKGSKYYARTGSDFNLYNKQNINTSYDTLIITEGEFDAMIIHQCGYKNVVSVPSGAESLDKLFKRNKDFIGTYNSLIVLGDNDKSGSNMDEIFVKEFGYKIKLPDKKLYKDCIDLNEAFLKYGKGQIDKIIRSASLKIEGLRNLDDQPYQGLDTLADGKYISTGLPRIDFAINDLAPGLVTLIAGRSNGGKSTLINQIVANAIDDDNKVLLISGEGIPEVIINNLYKAVIGRDSRFYEYKKINKRKFKEPNKQVIEALQAWHYNKLVLFNKGESNLKTTDELFELLNIAVKTNRHDLIVIDNLMSILSVEKASEKLEGQADFMQRCCDLAKAEKVHIILVLHPNKTVTKGTSMDFEQISGTLDLANKADNIIFVKRNYDEESLERGIDGEIEILKNRYFNDLSKINTHYDEETGLLLEIDERTGDYLAYTFKWVQYLNPNTFAN